MQTPALLPRLGRHLRLLDYAFHNLFAHMKRMLLMQGLTNQQLFLDSGLGANYLLNHLFNHGHAAGNDTEEILQLLLRDHRDALEKYIDLDYQPGKLRPAVYLHTHVSEKERAGLAPLEEDLLTAFGASLDRDVREGAREGFEKALKKYPEQYLTAKKGLLGLGSKATLYDTFKSGKVQNAIKKMDQKTRDAYCYTLFHALVLSEFRLPSLNRMAKALCEADYRIFFHGLAWVLDAVTGKAFLTLPQPNMIIEGHTESICQHLATLGGWLDAMDIPRAYLCAWAAWKLQYMPRHWKDSFAEVYGSDKALLTQALEVAKPSERGCLLRFLERLGVPIDPKEPKEIITKVLFDLTAPRNLEDEIKPLAEWLVSDSDADPAKLPVFEEFFHNTRTSYRMLHTPYAELDWAAWSLQGISPIPDRYLRYLVAQKQGLHIEYCILYLQFLHGLSPEDAARYIAGAIGSTTAVSILASRCSEEYSYNKALLRPVAAACVRLYPAETEAVIRDKDTGIENRLFLLDTLYTQHTSYNHGLLLFCLGDSSKQVRQMTVSYLMPKKELLEEIRPLTAAKKKAVRECAEQLVMAYEGTSGEPGDGGDIDILAFCTRHLPKSAKMSLKWYFPDGIPSVRRKDSEDQADEVVPLCYLALVLTSRTMELNPAMQKIRDGLRESDLHAIAVQVFGHWLSENAPSKNKAAMLLFALHAANEDILMLQKQIDDWSLHSRGAIASEAVRAMAMNGSDLALMTVDTLGRKAKNKQVRRAGQDAFAAAAKALGTTTESLGDRIIPNLGFDERGERVIDYGTRQFTAILSPSLSIELQDETGKTIKSLPKPGAKDDTEKAEAAKSDFAATKKSLKAVVTTQGARLEQALSASRYWNREAWKKLFVHNPIMHSFAIGLIWGIYKDDKLTGTFRYMEDGSFTTVDEEAFTFPEEGVLIGLVHPLDMDGELLGAWREQLSDYEILQPILQLDRPVYLMEPEEKSALILDRFAGKIMLGITLVGKLQKSGWYKGSVQDGGCFYEFYREIGGVGVVVNFSGMYVSPQPDEKITVGQVCFYRAGTVERGSYVYDTVTKENCIPLEKVSPRLFSETTHDLTVATATSTERDENWKKEINLLFDGK